MVTRHMRTWVQQLLNGECGSGIVRDMRKHYGSVASLKTAVSVVRRSFMDTPRLKRGQRQVHPSYPATIQRLSRHLHTLRRQCSQHKDHQHPGPTNGFTAGQAQAQCCDNLRDFLGAPLRRQVAIARAHRSKNFCFGVDAVDRIFAAGLNVLPTNMEGLRITQEEHDVCKAREVATQLRRNESMIVVDNGDGMLQKLQDLARRADRISIPALILALCGLSGRRFAEIVNGRSTFSRVDHTKYGCRFTGQLKKPQSAVRAGYYDIPLLAPFRVFQSALSVLRKRQRQDDPGFQKKSNAAATTRWQPRARLEVAKLFDSLRRPHDLRALYAAMVHQAFDFGAVTFNRVAMQVLGHSSLAQSLAYNTVLLKRFTTDLGKFPLSRPVA